MPRAAVGGAHETSVELDDAEAACLLRERLDVRFVAPVTWRHVGCACAGLALPLERRRRPAALRLPISTTSPTCSLHHRRLPAPSRRPRSPSELSAASARRRRRPLREPAPIRSSRRSGARARSRRGCAAVAARPWSSWTADCVRAPRLGCRRDACRRVERAHGRREDSADHAGAIHNAASAGARPRAPTTGGGCGVALSDARRRASARRLDGPAADALVADDVFTPSRRSRNPGNGPLEQRGPPGDGRVDGPGARVVRASTTRRAFGSTGRGGRRRRRFRRRQRRSVRRSNDDGFRRTGHAHRGRDRRRRAAGSLEFGACIDRSRRPTAVGAASRRSTSSAPRGTPPATRRRRSAASAAAPIVAAAAALLLAARPDLGARRASAVARRSATPTPPIRIGRRMPRGAPLARGMDSARSTWRQPRCGGVVDTPPSRDACGSSGTACCLVERDAVPIAAPAAEWCAESVRTFVDVDHPWRGDVGSRWPPLHAYR